LSSRPSQFNKTTEVTTIEHSESKLEKNMNGTSDNITSKDKQEQRKNKKQRKKVRQYFRGKTETNITRTKLQYSID
jgi:FKBP-type peptidyl-prolyl cis-trans isomerase